MKKVAINGFGRIGRLFFRQILTHPEMEVVAINDLGDIENLAYLLKYDSIYSSLKEDISVDGNNLKVDGKIVQVFQERNPADLPWKDLDIDVVIEATGAFTSYEKASAHTEQAGAKKVIITAPSKDAEGTKGGRTILMGINSDQLGTCSISSNGSCTTNASSPLVAILSKTPGIQKAVLNTVHGYTASQALTDGPTQKKDFRRGRAAAQNIIPSTTGAAIAVTKAIPELENLFDGMAMRVPVAVGSIVDLTFLSKNKTSVEEVNRILKEAAQSDLWKDLIKYTEEPIVSTDIIGQPYGAIIDGSYTKVIDGDLIKVLSWYDNEWGYVSTLVQHAEEAARSTNL